MNTPSIKTASITILIIAFTFASFATSALAQELTTFTPEDKFSIPELNGSISFVVNGSCSEAILVNNTWRFSNLRLNGSFPLGNLTFSAKNCNVTVNSFFAGNYFARRLGYLSYYAEGSGVQEVNLGFNTSESSNPSEWSLILPGGVFLAEGDGWRLLPDNTVVISGKTGNITIARFNYGLEEDNSPFYVKHSVAIITAVAVAATIGAAVIVKVKNRTGGSMT